MTIMGAINHIDAVKPNGYSQDEKLRWLSVLDGIVKREIIDTHVGGEDVEFNGYNENTAQTTEMLVPYPYDDIYIRWLEAQIDYASGEYGKYNNSVSLFNSTYDSYAKHYNRTHMPLSKNFTHF